MKKICIPTLVFLAMLTACNPVSLQTDANKTAHPFTESAGTLSPGLTAQPEANADTITGIDLENARKAAQQYVDDLNEKSGGLVTCSELRFDPEDPVRQHYRTGMSPENILVFKVDLDVRKAWDGFDAIKYTDWSVIITRSGKDSDWDFTDAGY